VIQLLAIIANMEGIILIKTKIVLKFTNSVSRDTGSESGGVEGRDVWWHSAKQTYAFEREHKVPIQTKWF